MLVVGFCFWWFVEYFIIVVGCIILPAPGCYLFLVVFLSAVGCWMLGVACFLLELG